MDITAPMEDDFLEGVRIVLRLVTAILQLFAWIYLSSVRNNRWPGSTADGGRELQEHEAQGEG